MTFAMKNERLLKVQEEKENSAGMCREYLIKSDLNAQLPEGKSSLDVTSVKNILPMVLKEYLPT